MIKTKLSINTLILLVTAFLTLFGNVAFVTNVLKAYPMTVGDIGALLSLIVVFGGATVLLLATLCFKHTAKPVLMIILVLSSLSAYFMDSYGIVISDDMLRNIAHTNTAETLELLNLKLLGYLAVLGILPALAVGLAPLKWRSLRDEIVSRLMLFGITLALMIGVALMFGSFYASFFREHKELRAHANPVY